MPARHRGMLKAAIQKVFDPWVIPKSLYHHWYRLFLWDHIVGSHSHFLFDGFPKQYLSRYSQVFYCAYGYLHCFFDFGIRIILDITQAHGFAILLWECLYAPAYEVLAFSYRAGWVSGSCV